MLPLGDWWTGSATRPGAPQPPAVPAATLAPCNLGYARGECARFPAGDGPDAVDSQFPATKTPSSASYYVVERDHHPFAHGRLEYSLAAAAFVTPPEAATLARQAQAYVESYLRRKKES